MRKADGGGGSLPCVARPANGAMAYLQGARGTFTAASTSPSLASVTMTVVPGNIHAPVVAEPVAPPLVQRVPGSPPKTPVRLGVGSLLIQSFTPCFAFALLASQWTSTTLGALVAPQSLSAAGVKVTLAVCEWQPARAMVQSAAMASLRMVFSLFG